MLRHNLSIQIINFNEIRILDREIFKKALSFGSAVAQIRKRETSTLHASTEVIVLDRDNEDTIVDLVQECTSNRLVLVLIN